MDEQAKREIKDILLTYDRTLLVADPRRCEPKKCAVFPFMSVQQALAFCPYAWNPLKHRSDEFALAVQVWRSGSPCSLPEVLPLEAAFWMLWGARVQQLAVQSIWRHVGLFKHVPLIAQNFRKFGIAPEVDLRGTCV